MSILTWPERIRDGGRVPPSVQVCTLTWPEREKGWGGVQLSYLAWIARIENKYFFKKMN